MRARRPTLLGRATRGVESERKGRALTSTAPAPVDPEAEYEAFVRANLRRNYAANYLHGMLGMTGFRLINAPTFVPAYLFSFTGSDIIVGLGLGLQQLGGVISPVFGAAHIEHRKRVVPAAMLLGTLMRVQILGLALSGWLLSGAPLLVAVLAFLFLLGLFGGPQRVAFQLLMAKVIPIDRRGRLQAWRNVTGGAIAAALSYFAGRWLIEDEVLGNGYATTFLLAFVLTSLGLTALRLLIREPIPPTLRPKSRTADRIREFPALLRADRDFAAFLAVQVLAMGGRVAAPFYILYAGTTVELTGATLGLLSLAFLGADTLANLVWGYAGDKFGFRATLLAAIALWIASTAMLLTADALVPILLAFVGLGAASSGYMMSSTTMVLEFGRREDIAMRIALSSTAEGAMAALAPLCGGLLAAALGYPVLFAISMALQGGALLLLLLRVREPRRRQPSNAS